MSAPARNQREVRRRPRRAAALLRRRESIRAATRISEEIRAQLIAAGTVPNPRPVGRELLRWAAERGVSMRGARASAILLELIPRKGHYVDQAPKSDDRHGPPPPSLNHLIAAPRTGPPAGAVAVGMLLPADCTGGAVIVP